MDLLDEELTDLPERPWVATWRSALKQLDSYPWTQLRPAEVYPEFRQRVFKALETRQKKGNSFDWVLWDDVLNIFVDQ